MEKYTNDAQNIRITARSIKIHRHVSFGKNINVNITGDFEIGSYSRLGDNTIIKGRNIYFGQHLYNSSGLNIGGGGFQHPDADFSIGDRCTIHNNFINVCEPVRIGDDVGLSPDTSILTHGYWLSVLEGFPRSSTGVTIGNGVIVGYRSLIMMGVEIANYCVVGAGSTVTKNLDIEKGIYAGIPARFIKKVEAPSKEKQIELMENMLVEYRKIAAYHGINPDIKFNFPSIQINDFNVNVLTFEYSGIENEETDDFRDYIRKWGIRIYTERPFVSAQKK